MEILKQGMNNISHTRRLLWIEGYGAIGSFLCASFYFGTHIYYMAILSFIIAVCFTRFWVDDYKKYKFLKKMQAFVDKYKPIQTQNN